MLDALSGVPDYQCRQMLGENYYRLDYTFPDGDSIAMDEWKKRDWPIEIGREEMTEDLERAAGWLTDHWHDG